MKNFLKNNINWKKFIKIEIWLAVVLSLVYYAGNNKFPHNFFIVPLITIVLGIGALLNAYYDYKIKTDKKEI